MNKITLVDTEINVAKHIAKLRTERSRGKTTTYGKKSQLQIDINAFGAELAFCKMFNLYPDLTTYARKRGPDCYLQDGKKVDVKQSSLKGDLIVSLHKEIGDADIYVLMYGVMPTYTYKGWAWDYEVVRAMNMKLVGEVTCYVLGRVHLHKGEPGYERSFA